MHDPEYCKGLIAYSNKFLEVSDKYASVEICISKQQDAVSTCV